MWIVHIIIETLQTLYIILIVVKMRIDSKTINENNRELRKILKINK